MESQRQTKTQIRPYYLRFLIHKNPESIVGVVGSEYSSLLAKFTRSIAPSCGTMLPQSPIQPQALFSFVPRFSARPCIDLWSICSHPTNLCTSIAHLRNRGVRPPDRCYENFGMMILCRSVFSKIHRERPSRPVSKLNFIHRARFLAQVDFTDSLLQREATKRPDVCDAPYAPDSRGPRLSFGFERLSSLVRRSHLACV